MFALGTQIAGAQGLKSTAVIAFMACGLVSLLAALTSVVGARCRLSTYQILAFSFGTRGAQLVNIVLAVMLLGWFAMTADMLGATVQTTTATLYGRVWPKWEFTCAALILMTTTGIFGFHVMERFVRVTVPLLTALMVFVVAFSISRSGLSPALHRAGDHTLSSVDALSSIIGAIVLTAVLAPDLTRYARNDRQALLSVLGVAVGFPAALILAAIPAAIYGKHDLMEVMALLQIPAIALVLLVISTWTSNTSNLYSATLTLATLFKRTSTRVLGLWGALLALAAASAGIADYFIPLLIALGVVSAPLAGIYVVDFWSRRTLPGSPAGAVPEGGELAASPAGAAGGALAGPPPRAAGGVLAGSPIGTAVGALAGSPPGDAASPPPAAPAGSNELPAFRPSALAAWALGSAVGLAETYAGGHALTRIPAIDSILITAIAQALMNRRYRHE